MLRIDLAPQQGETPRFSGLPSWMGRLLSGRGIRTEEEARRFLRPEMDQLLPPGALHDMEKAAALLRSGMAQGKKAAIYGDYDVDGVCACAILWEALGMLGLEREIYIPDRHGEGYGLNIPAVEKLAQTCRILITVDCGITGAAEVARAKELGMDVIVTDHHRHGDVLPPADAVVTPLLGDYPFPFLCGAGVAWKLALALLGDRAEPLMEAAALATVADMVPLTGENRVIVALGLKMAAATSRPGLRAVMNRAGIEGKITSDQVAFQIAPRMNACGRMESAQTALEMLLTRDPLRAEALALKMEGLNQERKDQENKVLRDAMEQVERMDLVETQAIVVAGDGWNSGVVGLAAGRIAEKYAYPTVALARDGDMCTGSARSAGDIDIHKALTRISDMFERFGGHRQAAGMTLRSDRVEELRERLSQAVKEQTDGKPVEPRILCDGELALGEVTEETVSWLERLEPFGIGNPPPRFLCRDVKPLSLRAVGADGKHLKCTFQQGGEIRDGIFFGGGEWAGRTEGTFRMVISPVVNEFRGRTSAECRLYALELQPEALAEDKDREAVSLFRERRGGEAARPAGLDEVDEWMARGQGTLLVCRCRDTALDLRRRYPRADFCLEKADDPRAYPTILLYGSAEGASPFFRRVVLCDGDTGESGVWSRACPKGEVYALPLSPCMKRLLAGAGADQEMLRAGYVALRGRTPESLDAFSGGMGVSRPQAAFILRVLADLALIEADLDPFRVRMLPMQKRDPEESGLFRLARHAREEMYGLHGL